MTLFALKVRDVSLVAIMTLVLAACGSGDQGDASVSQTGAGQDDPAMREAFAAADWPHLVSDLEVDKNVTYGVLENGLRYAILENDTPTGTAAMRLVFDTGSLAEQDHQRGLMHFIEHMAFNGTTNVPEGEMVQLLERYGLAFGPDTNAFTGREVVGYQLDLPSVDEAIINTGLFLMRETASEMTLDIEAIDRERGVILGEERLRNTPVRRFFNAYYDFLYPETIIVERDAIGTVEVIENANRDAFVELYERVYRPDRAMLVITGDIDPSLIEAKIRDGFEISIPGLDVSAVDSFETWQGSPDPMADPEIGSVGEFAQSDYGYFYDPEIFTLINIDVVSPGLPSLDTKENRFESLLSSLGNGIVQRRLQSLINSGEAPIVQANISYSNDFDLANRANAFAVSSPESWQEGLAVVEQELRRAREYGFTQAELNEQMANLRTALQNAADQAGTRQTPGLADSLWNAWLTDNVFTHPQYRLDWFKGIESEITLEAVETAFNQIWTVAPPQVFVSVNQDIDEPVETVQSAWENSQAQPVEAPEEAGAMEFAYTEFGEPGEIVTANSVEEFQFDQYVFDNGVALNVKTTDFEDNVIRIRVDFGAGDLTPQPTAAAGLIASATFGAGGLEAHDSDELQRLLAGRSVSYGVGVADDTFFFSSGTTPTDFELQMQVLTAFMTAPGWRDDGLRQFSAIAEELRRGQRSSATQMTQNYVSRLLRSGDPRWGFPTAEEVDAFSMEDAEALLGEALSSAPIEITIVGDIDSDTVIDVISRTFGALPDRADDWPSYEDNRQISFPDPVSDPVIVPFNGQDYQAMANIYWPTTDGEDQRRERTLTLMTRILDLKATDRFREQEAATYSAFVSNTESEVFEDYGYVWLGLDVTVDDLERMYEIADELAGVMASGDITEDELLRARQPLMESIEEARETNGFWLSNLARVQANLEKLDELRSLESDYRGITIEEISTLAEDYLQADRAWRVSIMPRSALDEAP